MPFPSSKLLGILFIISINYKNNINKQMTSFHSKQSK
jgi:hypothetical protein